MEQPSYSRSTEHDAYFKGFQNRTDICYLYTCIYILPKASYSILLWLHI